MTTLPVDPYITCKCCPVKYSTNVAFPQSRSKQAACTHEQFVYIFAGKDGNLALKDFWRFNTITYKWDVVTFRGDIPRHLEGHTLVSYKKLLLLFGGEFGDSLTESSLWIINPDLGYIRKSCLDLGSERPCIRRNHSAIVYRGAMYVYGGYIDIKGSSSELWKYHIDDEEWELIPSRQQSRELPGGRHGHSAVVYDNHMWLYGGSNDLHPRQDLWSYSFGVNRWAKLKLKFGPPALSGHTATLVGCRMFVFGGETSREPVNQLWYFCFKTEKWSQIELKEQIPARTFHSAVFVNPSQYSNAVKACSVPFLQNKMSKLSLERPKSSPGVRSSSTIPVETNSGQNQHSQSQENRSQAVLNRNNRSQGLPVYDSGSVESLKLFPSLAENAKDILPLCPKVTDFNYNAYDSLDRNKKLCGIDNPGISDSTEELIRQGRQARVEDTTNDLARQTQQLLFSRSASCTNETEQDRRAQLIRMDSVPLDTSHIMDSLSNHLRPKKSKLDPELILEDLENTDCFPYDVKLSHPNRLFVLSGRTYSGENLLLDSDGLETIELTGQYRTQNKSESNLCSQHLLKGGYDSVYFQCDTETLHSNTCLDPSFGNTRSKTNTTAVRDTRVEQGKSSIGCQRENSSDLNETTFSKNCRNDLSHGQPRQPKTSGNNNSVVTQTKQQTDQPYILVIGGKNHRTVHFGIKPLPLWKLKITPL